MKCTNMGIDIDRLKELVTDGLVTATSHPTEPLTIYNYSPICVFKRAWNRVTLQCRGLILDDEFNVIARPFEKFFNVEEESASDIRWKKSFQVFEKLDGSLGIMYPTKSQSLCYAIATRGSFRSDQAVEGTEMLHNVLVRGTFVPNDDYTYLFEIIYPENRIVLDYMGRRELVFLCAVHKETGANVFSFGNEWDWPGTHVKRHDNLDLLPIRELSSLEIENEEGFVVFFPHNSTRMKTKFTEYVRLHRIITNTNTKRIWESLKAGDPIEQIIADTPDEFFGWVKGVIAGFEKAYFIIEQEAQAKFAKIIEDPNVDRAFDRKAFAEKAAPHRYSGILFKMFDGKDYSEMIWKMIKPERAEGFAGSYNAEET